MEITTHLNDRPYRIVDAGEGDCYLFIIDGSDTRSLSDLMLDSNCGNNRKLIVDISLAQANDIEKLSAKDIEEIGKDIHLLIDIYWLDKVHICVDKKLDSLYHHLMQLLAERIINC